MNSIQVGNEQRLPTEILKDLIWVNRRVIVDETADKLTISTVLCIQFFTRTCSSGNFPRDGCQENYRLNTWETEWVVHQATGTVSKWRTGILTRMVTEDESGVHHFEPKSKRQIKYWKHASSQLSKEFQVQSSAGKVNLTLFWGSKGTVLERYQARSETVNCERYCAVLTDELKPVIRRKRYGR